MTFTNADLAAKFPRHCCDYGRSLEDRIHDWEKAAMTGDAMAVTQVTFYLRALRKIIEDDGNLWRELREADDLHFPTTSGKDVCR